MRSSVGAALTASVWFMLLRFVNLHSLRKCRPYGAQKSVETINPGLCRSVALAGIFDISPNQFLCYFDAVALPESGERGSISTATLILN